MIRKTWYMLLFTFLFVGLLMACSDDSSSEGEDGVVTITTARTIDDGTTFKDGDDVHENVVTRWAREELGINFEMAFTQPNDEQMNNQLRLMMSSGEQLPDVFQVNDQGIRADLIESGLVQPVDEAIEQYAPQRIKDLFEEFPEAFYPSTNDEGVNYGIPRYSGGNGSDTLLWIRQDWLEKFDLEIPTTISELEHVMDVFVNEDPNETGQDDTRGIAFSAGDNGFRSGNITDSAWVFGSFGNFVPGAWSHNDNGELVYGSVQPNMKDGLAKIKEWYDKGYLQTDFGILPASEAQEVFISGRAGIIAAPPWAHGWPLGEMDQVVPEAVLVPAPLPTGDDGQAARRGEGLIVGSFLFSTEFEAWEQFFEYWDAIFSYTLGDTDYFEHGLFEGWDYVMQDGEPVYDQTTIEEVTGEDFVDPGRYFLMTNIPTIPYQMYELLDDFHQSGRDPETGYEANLAGREADYIKAASIVHNQTDIAILNEFTGVPTPTMLSRSEHLERMEDEIFVDIIYGNEPLDAFDDFVEDWYSSGGEEITQEVREWYDSVQQ